jgi:mitogen-activated protein kinase kinase 7
MSTNGSSQGSHGSKSISTIESELEIMTKRLDSTSKTARRPRPAPMNLNTSFQRPPSLNSSMSSNSSSARLKPSLDLNSRRSGSGFAHIRGFDHENVQLVGLGQVDIDGIVYKNITERDFTQYGSGFLGSGTSGTVFKMNFKRKDVAVKQIAKSDDKDEMKRLRMDLGVMMKSNCSSIVKYLGAVNSDASVWIVMELMLTCFDKILKTLRMPIPVQVLGSLSVSVVQALNYLKEKHSTIHRDVKPSNILVDHEGRIKLCDFGISGRLVDSQARTRGAGCAAYLSPERIDPERGTYDVRADIWSLGLTLIELATAQFPYSNCKSDFEVCAKILQTEAPQLGVSFPADMQDFVTQCCIKNVEYRPKYPQLMRHLYYLNHLERRDRDQLTKKWLVSHNLLPQCNSFTPSNTKETPKTAVHTPQPVFPGFSAHSIASATHGRENWASFSNGQGLDTVGPINSVSVKIENNKNQDLISW